MYTIDGYVPQSAEASSVGPGTPTCCCTRDTYADCKSDQDPIVSSLPELCGVGAHEDCSARNDC